MTQTVGLKTATKFGDICIVFPLLKETEKAILIRVPQMGADLETTGFPAEMLGQVASKVREAI